MDKVGHVAAAPGPLACPSRGALPPVLAAVLDPESVSTRPDHEYILISFFLGIQAHVTSMGNCLILLPLPVSKSVNGTY